jgi:hypothetical protein
LEVLVVNLNLFKGFTVEVVLVIIVIRSNVRIVLIPLGVRVVFLLIDFILLLNHHGFNSLFRFHMNLCLLFCHLLII